MLWTGPQIPSPKYFPEKKCHQKKTSPVIRQDPNYKDNLPLQKSEVIEHWEYYFIIEHLVNNWYLFKVCLRLETLPLSNKRFYIHSKKYVVFVWYLLQWFRHFWIITFNNFPKDRFDQLRNKICLPFSIIKSYRVQNQFD